MSMPKYALHDFIATVPSCVQTTCLSVVLEIFELGQCDRLVVVSEQQYPIGVLYPSRLISYGCGVGFDVQQPLSALGVAVVEPIVTLPAELSVEQFRFYVNSQSKTNTDFDWALVDLDGKFLGLLDSTRLLPFLVSPASIDTDKRRVEGKSSHRHRLDRRAIDSLVQLLERLPWPLMLQTGPGEVITQNPAWCEQLGALDDSEAAIREVETILKTSFVPHDLGHCLTEAGDLCLSIPLHPYTSPSPLPLHPDAPPTIVNAAKPTPLKENDAASSSRCQIGAQPDTCICVWRLQNGQERVWQFVKIPLQESGLPFIPSPLNEAPHVLAASVSSTDLWLLLATDLTEQQQLASELAAKNADLIQLNRLKDEFLACISHELKTPLTAVMGLSTLLKDQTLGELNERQTRYARLIHQSGRHLMTVVNDILDLTRMETGQMELTLEPVKIATVCDRAVEQARAIQAKISHSKAELLVERPFNHRFTLVIEPGLELVADELRLRQMLIHLLSNALKFTETDGELGLRVSRWEGWIAFTIWDTGIGIPEQQQHLIFQKFQQLESPLTRQFEGTGLGLVLTRALARLHGGDVSFLSKEGKGSEFTLLLPPMPPHKRGGEVELNNRLVLVVEAAPRFIEDLTEHLTTLGYRVVIARSGTEALEKARRLQPGALFLNPLLPLLSGWDVLTLLKSDVATRQIPVIMTGTRAEKDQAFLNRADEFLSLPVQQQNLQQVMIRFCAQSPISQSSKGVSQSTVDTPLIILRLSQESRSTIDSELLHQHYYQVLEADNLEQAELLARIWQPDVVLLDGAIPNPLTYLRQLSQSPSLAALPIVALDAATAQVANQVTGLSIFPCLIPAEQLDTDALLPVLQIAIGINWKSNLLVVDIATLPDLHPSPPHSSLSRGSEWFQALIQYLQTAGFRSMISRSWAEVLQQIRQQSVDLLLICLRDSKLESDVLQALTVLSQQRNVPPVLVLDQRVSQMRGRGAGEQGSRGAGEQGSRGAGEQGSRGNLRSNLTVKWDNSVQRKMLSRI